MWCRMKLTYLEGAADIFNEEERRPNDTAAFAALEIAISGYKNQQDSISIQLFLLKRMRDSAAEKEEKIEDSNLLLIILQ